SISKEQLLLYRDFDAAGQSSLAVTFQPQSTGCRLYEARCLQYPSGFRVTDVRLSGSGELGEFAPTPDLPTLMGYRHANPPNVLRSLLTFTSESVGTVQVDVRGVRLLGIRVTPASEPAQPPLGPCGAAVYDFNTSECRAAVSLPLP